MLIPSLCGFESATYRSNQFQTQHPLGDQLSSKLRSDYVLNLQTQVIMLM